MLSFEKEACTRAANDINDLVPMVLESHPELALDPSKTSANAASRYLPRFSENSPPPQNWRTQEAWRLNPSVRREAQVTWLRQFFQRFKDDPSAFRSVAKIRERMRDIFGHRGEDEDLRSVRAEVFGAWALHMHKSRNAGQRFMGRQWAQRGFLGTPPQVKDLVAEGLIEHYKVPQGYHTSDQAISDYLDELERDTLFFQ